VPESVEANDGASRDGSEERQAGKASDVVWLVVPAESDESNIADEFRGGIVFREEDRMERLQGMLCFCSCCSYVNDV
jgi:hypothetical protein